MKVSDTQAIYKKRKNAKTYLKQISPAHKDFSAPKPLCVSIHRIAVDETTPLKFRKTFYKETSPSISVPTLEEEIKLLIAKFTFVYTVIKHNLEIVSTKGSNLKNNLKDTIKSPILNNQINTLSNATHLNSFCELKNLLIRTLDPDSQEKINNIKSLTNIMHEIESHPLCNDKILATLKPMYDKSIELSIQTIEAIQYGDISLYDLLDLSLSNGNVK